ncbi:hypothetical protein K3495_g16914 [Podosphaera aphanis]|nr:hypothetical protein K3495_g16914 [Podosphaera aphanis]
MDNLKEGSTPLYDSRSDQPVSWVKTLDNLPRALTKTKSLPPVAQINAGTPAPDDTSSGKSVEPMFSQQSRLETQGPALKSRLETQGPALKSRLETQGPALKSRLETQGPALKSRLETQGPTQHSRLETQGPTQHSRSETNSTASSLPNNKINPSNESDLQIE